MASKIVNPASTASAAGFGKMSALGGDNSEFYHNPRPLQAPRYEPRFRRQIESIHRQGPVVLGYLVEALAGGADLRATVAEFADLDSNFIAAYGGDRFPASLRAMDGGAP
jgi:hypothetical protein